MKTFTLSVLAGTMMILTACSSSSGGGQSNSTLFTLNDPFAVQTSSSTSNAASTTGSATRPAAQATSPSASFSPNTATEISAQNVRPFQAAVFMPSANPKALSGGYLAITADGKTSSKSVPSNYRDEELNELVINNTHIRLFNVRDNLSGTYLDTFKALSDVDVTEGKTGAVSGLAGGWGNVFFNLGFYNSRFGVYTVNHTDHLFVQGFSTPLTQSEESRNGRLSPMPTTGRNTYLNGQAIYGKEGNYESLQAIAVADFAEKTLNVSLSDSLGGAAKLQFSAKIEGNTFKGEEGAIHSYGGFFGSGADEAAGMFYQTEGVDKGKNGAFGVNNPRRER